MSLDSEDKRPQCSNSGYLQCVFELVIERVNLLIINVPCSVKGGENSLCPQVVCSDSVDVWTARGSRRS